MKYISKRGKSMKNNTKKHKKGGKKDCIKSCKKSTIATLKKTKTYKKISSIFSMVGLKDKYDQKIEDAVNNKTNPKMNTLIDICEKKCKKSK